MKIIYDKNRYSTGIYTRQKKKLLVYFTHDEFSSTVRIFSVYDIFLINEPYYNIRLLSNIFREVNNGTLVFSQIIKYCRAFNYIYYKLIPRKLDLVD